MHTIEEAIEDVRNGKIIIVVDDEDRENEGDFICAADCITPEIVNFMATNGRGLICTALVEDRCDELGLEMMVGKNTAAFETPFTVSVDLMGDGCTTGISASDRSKTIAALANPDTDPAVLGVPGHIFPLKAKRGGVLRRTGHTEASIDFARLAGFSAAGVLVEILNEDGTMARLPDLELVAKKFDLKLVSIEDLIAYRLENETLIEEKLKVDFPTENGDFTLHAFKQVNTDNIHYALVKGEWKEDDTVMVRVHSSNTVEDVFTSLLSNSGFNLHQAMKMVNENGQGVILYMNQHNSSDQIINKLKSYTSKEEKSKPSFKMDTRDFGIGAQILRKLGVKNIKLISNNPTKRIGIDGYGLKIVDAVPMQMDKV